MNLLIVDDEYLIIEDLLSITDWEMTGVTEIYTAMNAARAKQLLLEKQVDLMLCDIEMPQTDGLELLKWAKENCPSLEVIMPVSYTHLYQTQSFPYPVRNLFPRHLIIFQSESHVLLHYG